MTTVFLWLLLSQAPAPPASKAFVWRDCEKIAWTGESACPTFGKLLNKPVGQTLSSASSWRSRLRKLLRTQRQITEPRAQASGRSFFSQATPPQRVAPKGNTIDVILKEIAESGRVLTLVRSLDDTVRIAPGAPPLLTFRYLDGRQRGRFGGLDLVLDDAGH